MMTVKSLLNGRGIKTNLTAVSHKCQTYYLPTLLTMINDQQWCQWRLQGIHQKHIYFY